MREDVNPHPYEALTPDCVLDAVESAGFLSDLRILALNSYDIVNVCTLTHNNKCISICTNAAGYHAEWGADKNQKKRSVQPRGLS